MLEEIKLKNYRNISSIEASIKPGANIIIASNGSGKTNILESIYYLIFGSSFRSLKFRHEVIQINSPYSKIRLKWDSDILDLSISNIDDVITKKVLLNLKKYPSAKLTHRYPVILFAPHSVDLITGEPALRRLDLDAFLGIISNEYYSKMVKYKIILKNRNAVIKQIRDGKTKSNSLHYWTEEIINLSFIIYQFRLEYFSEINEYITESIKLIYLNDPNQFKVSIEYLPNLKALLPLFKDELRNKFTTHYDKEILIGKTLFGVHKDDYLLNLNGNSLKYIGSRGQQRIGTLVIKIAQLQYYYDKFSKYPLFLVDDLMSELDQDNREKVADYLIDTDIQFILTSADTNEVPTSLKKISNFINLNQIIY